MTAAAAPLLLRHLRRFTSLDGATTAARFLEVECRDRDGRAQLELSVYRIADAPNHVIQVEAEHLASFADPPEDTAGGLSLQGFDIEAEAETGGTAFRFTQECHANMIFLAEDELLVVLAAALAAKENRARSALATEVQAYVYGRLVEGDDEWTPHCKKKRKWAKWAMELQPQLGLPTTVVVATRPAPGRSGDVTPAEEPEPSSPEQR